MVEVVEFPDENQEATFIDFKDRVFAAAAESVEWATACLIHFELEGGTVVDIRTGVLIEIADHQFLVTAAHGMQEHFDKDHILNIIVPDKGSIPVPVLAEKWWSTVDSQEDLNVCRLLPETVKAMGPNFRFLRLSQMMSQNNREHGKGFYLLLGYPNAMRRPDGEGANRCDTWKYLTTQFEGDTSRIENYEPRLHLVVRYERETRNLEGEKVHPPGMSGCGIYFCGHPLSRSILRHEDLKLVAIQTAWHKGEEYAKGTWVDDALLIIWKYYPAVRDPMRFHGISF